MKPKALTFIALLAAILCIFAPFSIPLGPVPLTLATLAVYFIAAVAGWRRGCLAVLIYLALGCLGLPVFSGFSGGFQKLAGPTGGYLLGYLPCALIVGLMTDFRPETKWVYPVSMVLGTLALYACGTAFFMIEANTDLTAALGLCVLPFLPGDAVKIACASLLAFRLRPRIKRFSDKEAAHGNQNAC